MNRRALTALGGGYAADGWKQWPDDEEFSAQFVRILAAAQDGASTLGECFQAAGHIAAGDRNSWHEAWLIPAARSVQRAEQAESERHRLTARANWIRAANYFRAAEFFLDPRDPRRPTVVAFGGLDEFKDELIQEMERYALARGLSLLLVDLPGQGGTLRKRGLTARYDTEVPVGACIDYLLTRKDVAPDRIGLYGASLGSYYVTRAASREHRVRCAVSDAAQWKVSESATALSKQPDSMTAVLSRWVFGARDMDELIEIARPFDLEPVVKNIRCPLLIVSGELDSFGTHYAKHLYDADKAAGVDVTLKWFTAEETGAAHCQIDNPTPSMELICDWFVDRLT